MCERDDPVGSGLAERNDWSVNRRRFAAMGALGTLAACTAAGRTAPSLAEDDVRIDTADGTMDAFYVRPSSGRHPAVLTWPDIAGLRDAFEVMARRLAGQGYAVLVANPYYRSAPAPVFRDFAAFRADDGFAKVAPMRAALTPEAVMRDARSAIGWLDAKPEVDTARGIGSNGYCMGGPFTIYTAAAVPLRVRAAASLHGAGLVQPGKPDSPHAMLGRTRADCLFAIAQNDDADNPDAKTALREGAAAAHRPAEVEVYPADHGWTVIDSPAYERAAAERAWGRMTALFARAL